MCSPCAPEQIGAITAQIIVTCIFYVSIPLLFPNFGDADNDFLLIVRIMTAMCVAVRLASVTLSEYLFVCRFILLQLSLGVYSFMFVIFAGLFIAVEVIDPAEEGSWVLILLLRGRSAKLSCSPHMIHLYRGYTL